MNRKLKLKIGVYVFTIFSVLAILPFLSPQTSNIIIYETYIPIDFTGVRFAIDNDESVDADSNVDAVANIGNNNATYTDAQTLNEVYQGITEGQGSGYVAPTDTEDFTDSCADNHLPTNLGTYSDETCVEFQDFDDNMNTLTEENTGAGSSGGELPSAKDTVASDTTTSATYEDVDGLTTTITTSATSDILLFASIQAIGTTEALGGWRLVFDSVNFLDLERHIESEAGNLMLVDLVIAKSSGVYTFKLQHKVDTGTLTTANAIITAISLHNTDGVIPANSSYVASDTVGNAWADVVGLEADITLSSTSDIFAIMVMNGYHSGNNKDTDFAINIDSTRMEEHDRDYENNGIYGCASVVTRTDTPKTSGTYNVKVEWRGSGGSTMTGEDFKLVVIASEANSGANTLDIQKVVITTETTTATTIEDIDGLSVTANVVSSSHVLSVMTLSSDVSVVTTSAYTTMSIGGIDYDIMERGHHSATRWGSIGQVVRTDSKVSTNQIINGRWFTDSGNTLTGGNIILVSIVLWSGVVGATNYEFDREFSFTSLDSDDTGGEELIINTGTIGTETLLVYIWNSGSWQSIGSIVDANDNVNITIDISSYLDASAEDFRFLGNTESSDTTLNTWDIDGILIHTWNDEVNDYELDWEHQAQSLPAYSPDNTYALTIYGSFTQGGGETIGLEMWNSSSSAWVSAVSLSILSTDQWYNATITCGIDDPTGVCDTTMTWRFFDDDQALDSTQDELSIDYSGVYIYSLSITESSDNPVNVTVIPDGSDTEFNQFPFTITVDAGQNFDLEIKCADVNVTACGNGWVYYDIDTSPAGYIQLLTTYTTIYSAQDKSTTVLSIYLWANVPSGQIKQTHEITISFRISLA